MDTPERVMVVITEPLLEGRLLDELCSGLASESSAVALVAPAIGELPPQPAQADVDDAIREARNRLELSLQALGRRGISAFGEVGVSDPVAAASEALHQYPAELILVVAAERDRGGWENGLFERAQNELDPPVRMVAIGPQQAEPAAPRPAAPIHHAGRAERLPRFSNGDPVAIGAAVVGAILGIAVIVLILISLFD